MWTLGRKLALALTTTSLLLVAIGVIAHRGTRTLMDNAAKVTHTHEVVETIETLLSAMKDAETGQRGYVITGDAAFLDPYQSALVQITKITKRARDLTADNGAQQKRLDEIETLIGQKLAELAKTIALRNDKGFEETRKVIADGVGKRVMDAIRAIAADMERDERILLSERAQQSAATAARIEDAIVYGTLTCLCLALAIGWGISRSVTKQISASVQRVQSSSAELQTAAAQQASGAKELATSMTEITTTLNELLATSRQIAESAQRVMAIAGQTSESAQSGDGLVGRGQESMTGMRKQIDLVVTHMLDLGKRSQQIGAVLEIVGELADQTNILAINATIEASGAGEAGKRFGVVADEIRKLADRVQASTKEVRTMIEDIRGSVNTAVMATETGSKAVDLGARHFVDVAGAFKQIATLIGTTSDAAREIGLSTKQQTTAVEQVNIAIAGVAGASKESEVSTSQTLQTASELATLSRRLLSIVQAGA